MLNKLLQILTPDSKEEESQSERVPLAAAVLLLEVAYADGEFHPAEQELVGSLLRDHFSVRPESVDGLLQLAAQKRDASYDLHQFTKEINWAFSQWEKEQIIEAVWELVYADGRLDQYEEALMRQLGNLIGLSHRQLIEAKLRAKGDDD